MYLNFLNYFFSNFSTASSALYSVFLYKNICILSFVEVCLSFLDYTPYARVFNSPDASSAYVGGFVSAYLDNVHCMNALIFLNSTSFCFFFPLLLGYCDFEDFFLNSGLLFGSSFFCIFGDNSSIFFFKYIRVLYFAYLLLLDFSFINCLFYFYELSRNLFFYVFFFIVEFFNTAIFTSFAPYFSFFFNDFTAHSYILNSFKSAAFDCFFFDYSRSSFLSYTAARPSFFFAFNSFMAFFLLLYGFLVVCLFLYAYIIVYFNISFSWFFLVFFKFKSFFDFDFDIYETSKVFYIILLLSFFSLLSYTSFVYFSSFSDIFFFYLFIVFFFCAMMAFIYIFNFGVFFFIYLFGSSTADSFIKDFISSWIDLISFIFRFFLQIIRVVLIVVFYFLLHEYVYFDVLFFFKSSESSPLLNIFLLFLRLIFELVDFFFLLFVQFLAYVIIIFLFFSFLYTNKVALTDSFWFSYKFTSLRGGQKLICLIF